MKCEPTYVSETARVNAQWQKASEASGLPVDVLKEIFFTVFCAHGGGEFCRLVISGRFKPDYLLNGKTLAEWQGLAAASAIRRQKDPLNFADDDLDNNDRLAFGLKQVIEVGDSWECDESKSFRSGGEYHTKGRCYCIIDIQDRSFGDFSLVVRTNFRVPNDRTWLSGYGVRRLFREGRLIWEWKAAWIRDWNERNPTNLYPCSHEDLALFAELGWPKPASPVEAPPLLRA